MGASRSPRSRIACAVRRDTVTDGHLTLSAAAGALDPALCLIEVGPKDSTVDQALIDHLAEIIERANARTGGEPIRHPPTPRTFAFGGDYIDAPLAMRAGSGTAAKTYFIHANHLFSPQAITDSTGAVVERYSYTAFGERTVIGGSSEHHSDLGLNFGFTGLRDDGGGLLFARSRYFSPELGRFISRDPAGYVDGYSLYNGYFVPNGLDPTGLSETWNWDFSSFWSGTFTLVCSPVHFLFDIPAYIEETAANAYFKMMKSDADNQAINRIRAMRLGEGSTTAGNPEQIKQFQEAANELANLVPGTSFTGPAALPTRVGYVPHYLEAPIANRGAQDIARIGSRARIGCGDTTLKKVTWYHGTSSTRVGSIMNKLDESAIKATPGHDDRGFFVTSDPMVAEIYAKRAANDTGGYPVVLKTEGSVIGDYLDVVRTPAGGEMMIPVEYFNSIPPMAFSKDVETTVRLIQEWMAEHAR